MKYLIGIMVIALIIMAGCTGQSNSTPARANSIIDRITVLEIVRDRSQAKGDRR